MALIPIDEWIELIHNAQKVDVDLCMSCKEGLGYIPTIEMYVTRKSCLLDRVLFREFAEREHSHLTSRSRKERIIVNRFIQSVNDRVDRTYGD